MDWKHELVRMGFSPCEHPAETQAEGVEALEALREHVGVNFHVRHSATRGIHCIAVVRERDGALVAISMLPGFAWAVRDARGAFDRVTKAVVR